MLTDIRKLRRVLDLFLLAQIITYGVDLVLRFEWRQLDPAIYTGQAATVSTLMVFFVILGGWNALLLMVGLLEAPNMMRFLRLRTVAMISLIILLIVITQPIDNWMAMHSA